ncbi:hypothetical protein F5887DRAFT_973608 [Amanita rubescens]|nr:hypothetical protein F5887DRAFT_973608 [Amanita rubescens]
MASSQLTTTNSAPEFPYSGFTDLVEQIRNNTGDIIIINNVSLANFTQIFSEREKRGLGFRLSLYTADPGRLIVTIPTVVHEALHLYLSESIREITGGMGVPRRDLQSVGSGTFTNHDDTGNVSGRMPTNGFPTVVIEAGYTQSWDELRQKGRWWFAASHFDVKIVILAKFDRSRGGRITIEKWKAVQVLRPGVRTRLEAACIQSIHITRRALANNPADPESYDVTAPLRIEFVDVYLRQPVPGQEGDIVIDVGELQKYAADFWVTKIANER